VIRALLLLAATLSATQAAALTCVPPDPLRSFREANAAPESYVVLHGRLHFDPALMPGADALPPPGAAETRLDPVEARFEGFALGLAGFTRPVSATVVLEPSCLGQFCAGIGPGDGWLLFARPSGTGAYHVAIEPCGNRAFDGVPRATLDALATCLQGGPCGE
jgi:hypothetical protein